MPEPEIPIAQRRRTAALAGHLDDVDGARALTSDADEKVRATAYAALGRLDRLDAADLTAALADQSPYVRRRAATLAADATERDTVFASLFGLLSDDDDDLVVEAAAWSFGEWAQDNPGLDRTIAELARQSEFSEEPLVREAAAAALGAIGDERGLPAILRACTDKPAVRRRAVLALAPFDGPEVEAAIDKALADRDWQVRQAAEDLRR